MVATMKDVAKQAGVSVATVSRVLNDNGFVSPELRQRVQAAMQSMNYHPSHLARSLRRQRTQTIAIIMPRLDQPFFSSLALAIQKHLFEAGYYVFTCNTMDDHDDECAYINVLVGQRVDGVVIAPTQHDTDNLHRLLQTDIPVVLIDRDVPQTDGVDRVLFNNYEGGCMGINHLMHLGHSHIAVIGGPLCSLPVTQRIEGAQAAADHQQVRLDVVTPTDKNLQQYELGYKIGMDILDVDDPPTAIFALSDTAAVGVIHAANKLGIAVPKQLSVVGFDDIPLATYSFPALTTVAQPIHKMGMGTAQALLQRLDTPDHPPYRVVHDPKLIERQSTATPQH